MRHRLSKSRFQTGLQCGKALWLKCRAPRLADPVSELQQHIFDTGTEVGELARMLFPGGVLVAEDHLHSAEALSTTARLLEDPPPALFEAALEHADVFVRPDVLVRAADGAWDLYEVKASTKLKDEHVTDVAVQMWVLEGAGLRVRRAHLMHLDNTYVHDGGDYDLEALFTSEDVTAEARSWQQQVPTLVQDMLAMLQGPEPQIRVGRRCRHPYTCAFFGHCHSFLPERPVTALPRISADVLDALLAEGIHDIADVPATYPGLTAVQRGVCEVVRSGEPQVVGHLQRSLSRLQTPLYFLDFETLMSALPLYAGSRPWQSVPFQWSCHVLAEDGTLEHREFLYEGADDPRPAFTESLLEALGDHGSVLVYSAFENTRLTELAEAFPEHAHAIGALKARLVDLEKVVKQHLRHPACLGSTSIKVVLPALAPDLSYAGLGIAEGGTAALRYWQAATGRLAEDERAQVYVDLRAYCGTDTLAMVRVLAALQELASDASPPGGHRRAASAEPA
jgi:hypothetical protein